MTSFLFNMYFYAVTASYAILATPLAFLRSNKPLATWVHWWSRSMRFGMKHIARITIEVRGQEHRRDGETVIFAAKHQSIIDAIILYSEMPNLAAVAMAELSSRPVIGRIFHKLEMIMVDRANGSGARSLASGAEKAIAKGRPIVIYPEGEIRPVGERGTYKKGVWHLQKAHGLPVVPVATNMGLCWEQNKWKKNKGHVVVEFLPPVKPALEVGTFLSDLENKVESKTQSLLREGRSEQKKRQMLTQALTMESAIYWSKIPPVALMHQV